MGCLLCCCEVDAPDIAEDALTGRDKAEPFVATAGSEYRQRQHLSDWQSWTIGVLFSLRSGAGKEEYDSRPNSSGWSGKDFAWDAAGTASGIALWNLSH